jgi:hypothetical protein
MQMDPSSMSLRWKDKAAMQPPDNIATKKELGEKMKEGMNKEGKRMAKKEDGRNEPKSDAKEIMDIYKAKKELREADWMLKKARH